MSPDPEQPAVPDLEAIDHFFDNWCNLPWTGWIPFSATKQVFNRIPREPGLYRIRPVGKEYLVYIGETKRTLRERLHTLRLELEKAEQMPWSDPHTEAPALWAWRAEWLSERERQDPGDAMRSCPTRGRGPGSDGPGPGDARPAGCRRSPSVRERPAAIGCPWVRMLGRTARRLRQRAPGHGEFPPVPVPAGERGVAALQPRQVPSPVPQVLHEKRGEAWRAARRRPEGQPGRGTEPGPALPVGDARGTGTGWGSHGAPLHRLTKHTPGSSRGPGPLPPPRCRVEGGHLHRTGGGLCRTDSPGRPAGHGREISPSSRTT